MERDLWLSAIRGRGQRVAMWQEEAGTEEKWVWFEKSSMGQISF